MRAELGRIVLCTAMLASTGCELVVDFDRSQIPEDAGTDAAPDSAPADADTPTDAESE